LTAGGAGIRLLAGGTMKKTWKASYEGHEIMVENTGFEGERLYIDGKKAAETKRPFIFFLLPVLDLLFLGTNLKAEIPDGKGKGAKIKATLGGVLTVKCRIYANESLIFEG
jgi:hypothetical protein